MNKSFNTRAFTAILLAVSCIGLPISGLMLHESGGGPMGQARHSWMAAHNVFALVFTVSAVWHIVLNRAALFRHLKGAAGRIPSISREAIAALCTFGVLAGLFVGHSVLTDEGEHRGPGHGQSRGR